MKLKNIDGMNIRNITLTATSFILIRLLFENIFSTDLFSSNLFLMLPNLIIEFALYFISFIFIFNFFLKTKSANKTKNIKDTITFVLFIWPFIVMPPIVNAIFLGTKNRPLTNFYFIGTKKLFKIFFQLFGPSNYFGLTFGMKLSFICAVIGFGVFVFIKSRNLIKSIFASLTLYITIFFYSSIPVFFTFIYKLPSIGHINLNDLSYYILTPKDILGFKNLSEIEFINISISIPIFIFFIILITFFFFYYFKDQTISFLKNIRFSSLLIHWIIFFVGLIIAGKLYSRNLNYNIYSFLIIILSITTITIAWFASVCDNDLNDIDIDYLSNNKSRPLIKKIFTKKDYRDFSFFFSFISIVGISFLGPVPLSYLLGYLFLSFVYNNKPLRLKKYPLIANFIIALSMLFICLMGFTLIAENQSSKDFPWQLIVIILVGYTLASPVKDLKDIKADKKGKILTIPAIFGIKKAKKIMGLLLFFTLIFPSLIFLNIPFALISIFLGSILFYFFTQKNYKTNLLIRIVFLIHFVYFLFALILFINGELILLP